MSVRIDPAVAPFSDAVQSRFDRLMPAGVPPLRLFTMLARDERLFTRFMDGGLLDKGNLSLRHREIVIDRVTANCGCEYEWSVHVTLFAARAGFTEPQLRSLVHGNADDPCWQEASECVLIRVCDALHAQANIDDDMWAEFSSLFGEMACVEVLMLAGFYRMVSYLANATRLPPEPYAARFPTAA